MIELKTVNPKVFNDPKHCENNQEACQYLTGSACHLFNDKDDFATVLHLPFSVVSLSPAFFLKCDECKEHYQRNK